MNGRRITAAPAGRRVARRSVVVEARKVAVLGAAGGIGQPLSLLLKMNKLITELALYDIANVAGVAADLSHCNTPVKVGTPRPPRVPWYRLNHELFHAGRWLHWRGGAGCCAQGR